MYWEKTNELIHPLVHVSIELGKRNKVLSDLGLLINSFFQKALSNDKLYIVSRY